MQRSLAIEIDSSTWPARPSVPSFPSTFHSGRKNFSLNVPEVLLAIGLLTTPSHARGISLNAFWAWIRYFYAIANQIDLRISDDFADLDAHQKTILSDDFGMGFPIHWLLDKLQISLICDGRYFIQNFASSCGATVNRTSKRGPNKSPDFVAQDVNGFYHVVECKGTQSGQAYSNSQIGERAISQKNSIGFPTSITGQRLVCGMSIKAESDRNSSILKIIDPPLNDERLVIRDHEMNYARDAVMRGSAAKCLRMSGFEATALAMSAPKGLHPYSRPSSGREERIRRTIIEQKEKNAVQELESRSERHEFSAMMGRCLGRQMNFDLPFPLIINDRLVRNIQINQGINSEYLAELHQFPIVENLLVETNMTWPRAAKKISTESDASGAQLSVGSFFHSEIVLKD